MRVKLYLFLYLIDKLKIAFCCLVALLIITSLVDIKAQNNFIIAPTLGTHQEFISGCHEVGEGYISIISSFDFSMTPGTFGLHLFKFSKEGEVISVRNIVSDTSKYYLPRSSSLKRLPNNNFLVFGGYENVGTNRFTSFMMEINENGDILKMKESSPDFESQNQFNYDAIIDSATIKMLCLDTIMQNTNVRIDLYDLELNKLNETSFELSNGQADSYFIPLKSGGYAVAGFHVRALRVDSYLMVLDSDLEKKWHRFFISNGSGIIMEQPGIAELSNGDLVLSTGLMKGGNRILKYLVRINPETNKIVWEKNF